MAGNGGWEGFGVFRGPRPWEMSEILWWLEVGRTQQQWWLAVVAGTESWQWWQWFCGSGGWEEEAGFALLVGEVGAHNIEGEFVSGFCVDFCLPGVDFRFSPLWIFVWSHFWAHKIT